MSTIDKTQHLQYMATRARAKQLEKEGYSSHEAEVIIRYECLEDYYREAEQKGCSWYEVQMLRKQDYLIDKVDSIYCHLAFDRNRPGKKK